MKGFSSKEAWVACFALLAWIAEIVVLTANPDTRSRALVPTLVCSVVTMIGAAVVSRYWVKRKTTPSFGSLFAVPLACSCLVVSAPLFWEACRYGNWYLFTPDYWAETKGGFAALFLPIGMLWGLCIFPAAAVILLFQKQHGTDTSTAL